MCRGTLNALAFIHNKGHMHRDIKAANILLNHNGDIKLADFGISTQIVSLGRQTQCGTFQWLV